MTLTIQDLGALGEFFGSIAVLATLVYLALQTRQNTMAISAQLDAARLGAAQTLNLAAATSTELQEALNGDRVESLTLEQARLDFYWTARFFVTQWNFTQQRRGLLSPAGGGSDISGESRMAIRIRGNFNDFRSLAGWWEAVQHRFAPEFVEWVEDQRSKAA